MTFPLDVTSLKAAVNSTLVTTATIQRRTFTSDGAGGFTETYPVVDTTTCSFEAAQITPLERENAVGIQTISYFNFVFPAGTDIRSTDRIVIGSRTFEVVAPRLGSLEIDRRVLAQEIY